MEEIVVNMESFECVLRELSYEYVDKLNKYKVECDSKEEHTPSKTQFLDKDTGEIYLLIDLAEMQMGAHAIPYQEIMDSLDLMTELGLAKVVTKNTGGGIMKRAICFDVYKATQYMIDNDYFTATKDVAAILSEINGELTSEDEDIDYVDEVILETVKPEHMSELLWRLHQSEIRTDTEIKDEGLIWSMGDTPIGAANNLVIITGKKKSRKTFLALGIAASVISPKKEYGIFKSEIENDKGRVLIFDTEQSQSDTKNIATRISEMTGVSNPEKLNVYNTKGWTPADVMVALTERLAEANDVSLVMIDGIRDLVSSINDEEKAIELLSWIAKMCKEHSISVVAALHENKTDNRLRGWLGTEADNKAYGKITVTKKNTTTSTASITESRCAGTDDVFVFDIVDGIPEFTETLRGKRVLKLKGISDSLVNSLFSTIYLNDESFSVSDLKSEIKGKLQEDDWKLFLDGDNAIKEFITHCEEKNILTNKGATNRKKLVYNEDFNIN